ncbi:hypothetical protein V2G26_008408 [Clonostachys chloroleuca]
MVVRAVCLIPMITVGFSVMAGWVEAASTRPLRGGLGIKDVTEAPGIWPVDVTAKGEGGGTSKHLIRSPRRCVIRSQHWGTALSCSFTSRTKANTKRHIHFLHRYTSSCIENLSRSIENHDEVQLGELGRSKTECRKIRMLVCHIGLCLISRSYIASIQ